MNIHKLFYPLPVTGIVHFFKKEEKNSETPRMYYLRITTALLLMPFLLGPDAQAGLLSSCARSFGILSSSGGAVPTKGSFYTGATVPLRDAYYKLFASKAPVEEIGLGQRRLFTYWSSEAAQGRAYKPVLLRDRFVGEHVTPGLVNGRDKRLVEYVKPEDLPNYEVKVFPDGLLRRADGELLGTCKEAVARDECDKFIFIMDPQGRIFVREDAEPGAMRFKHSSFLSGAPVAASGKMEVKNGKIYYIDSNSGHYRPNREHFMQVIRELEARRANLKDVKITINHP